MNKLKLTILSMSTLTVMAGAAISPALHAMSEYFSDVSPTSIKMLITLPCLFIIITSLSFQKLSNIFNIRTLASIGVTFYFLGGCLAGFFSNIYAIFALRALLGVGVGIIMPLSTGLLAYYFDRSEQQKLMGYSAAMNNLGGIIATMASGFLTAISWRYSFAVYLIGAIVAVLVLVYLPKDRLSGAKAKVTKSDIKTIAPYMVCVFLLMLAYMSMPTNFAMVAKAQGIVSNNGLGILMSVNSIVALLFGFILTSTLKIFKSASKYVAFFMLTLGIFLLSIMNTLFIAVIGMSCIGVGMGMCVPIINSQISFKLDSVKVPAAMSLMSAMLYLGQFLSPLFIDFMQNILGLSQATAPFMIASIICLLLFIIACKTPFKI